MPTSVTIPSSSAGALVKMLGTLGSNPPGDFDVADKLDNPTHHHVEELDNPTHPAEEPAHVAVREGREAWGRLRSNPTLKDWKKVGTALVIGRVTAMRDAHTNKPKGRNYNAAFAAWAKKNGVADLDKGDRSRLADLMDHIDEIEVWLEKLTPAERLRLNHPSTILRRWKAATAVRDPNAPPKVSPTQKLKDELVAVIKERDRYKHEVDRGGGDLWTAQDRPQDIAKVIFSKLSRHKAEEVAREIMKCLKS